MEHNKQSLTASGQPEGFPDGRFLKWDNNIIGIIDRRNEVSFVEPDYNEVVSCYTGGARKWTPEQLTEFLSERIVSHDRRDIEKILFRCGLPHYDVLRIAEITSLIPELIV